VHKLNERLASPNGGRVPLGTGYIARKRKLDERMAKHGLISVENIASRRKLLRAVGVAYRVVALCYAKMTPTACFRESKHMTITSKRLYVPAWAVPILKAGRGVPRWARIALLRTYEIDSVQAKVVLDALQTCAAGGRAVTKQFVDNYLKHHLPKEALCA